MTQGREKMLAVRARGGRVAGWRGALATLASLCMVLAGLHDGAHHLADDDARTRENASAHEHTQGHAHAHPHKHAHPHGRAHANAHADTNSHADDHADRHQKPDPHNDHGAIDCALCLAIASLDIDKFAGGDSAASLPLRLSSPRRPAIAFFTSLRFAAAAPARGPPSLSS